MIHNRNSLKRVIFLVTIFVVYLASLSPAHAYLCWDEKHPKQVLENADYVFTGVVKGISDLESSEEELKTARQSINFKIKDIWKGFNVNPVFVEVDTESFYEYDFKLDTEYLVYAYNLYDGRISIVGCPRVKEVTAVAKDIRLLGNPLELVANGNRATVIEVADEPEVVVEEPASEESEPSIDDQLLELVEEDMVGETVTEADLGEETVPADIQNTEENTVESDNVDSEENSEDTTLEEGLLDEAAQAPTEENAQTASDTEELIIPEEEALPLEEPIFDEDSLMEEEPVFEEEPPVVEEHNDLPAPVDSTDNPDEEIPLEEPVDEVAIATEPLVEEADITDTVGAEEEASLEEKVGNLAEAIQEDADSVEAQTISEESAPQPDTAIPNDEIPVPAPLVEEAEEPTAPQEEGESENKPNDSEAPVEPTTPENLEPELPDFPPLEFEDMAEVQDQE